MKHAGPGGYSAPAGYSAAVWDIAVPSGPARLPGLSMAGFRSRVPLPVEELRVVPYPAITVLLDLRGEILLLDEQHGRRHRGSVAAGLVPGAIRYRGRDVDCLQVRLSPVMAHAVLGDPAELSGTAVALEDLWGRAASRIEDQLRAARSREDRFALVEAAFGRRLREGRAVSPEIGYAWQRIAASRGQVRVERLADETGWSRKRLWSRFRAQVGISPKRAARLVRFDDAVHRLCAGQRAADAAADAGYADQPHLNREIVAFTGTTPAAVAAAPWLMVDDIAWNPRGNISSRPGPAGP